MFHRILPNTGEKIGEEFSIYPYLLNSKTDQDSLALSTL